MRAEPSATSAEKSQRANLTSSVVWSESDKNNVSSQRWKQGSKRGTIDPGVVVRRSRFETTALEMPAGFGLLTIALIFRAIGGRARTYGQAM